MEAALNVHFSLYSVLSYPRRCYIHARLPQEVAVLVHDDVLVRRHAVMTGML